MSSLSLFGAGIVILALLTGAVKGQTCWNTLTEIRSGTITPISGLTASTTTTSSLTTVYGTAFDNTTTLSWALGVVGYDAYLNEYFSFNTTVNHIDWTGITITAQPGDGNYFSSLRVRYLVTSLLANSTPAVELAYGCYKCLDIINGYGERNEDFNQTSAMVNSSTLVVRAFLYAWNLTNNIGEINYVRVSSWLNGSQYVHTAYTSQNVTLNSICISVIAYDTVSDSPGFGNVAIFDTFTLDATTRTSGVTYRNRFDCDYVGFFGVSMVNHTMGSNRLFGVYPEDYPNFNTRMDYNTFFAEATIQILYLGSLVCSTTIGQMYEPTSYSCVTNCTANLYANNSNTCTACSTACATCDPQDINNCASCSDATRNGTNCDCLAGYFDAGAATCELCENHLANCTTCSNSSVCQVCSTGMYLINGTCQCSNASAASYLVGGVCLLFPGCSQAVETINFNYCDLCNDTANFEHPTTSNLTCQCKTGYDNSVDASVCSSTCGDGLVDAGGCDDNNTVNGDGCDSACNVETGWHCSVSDGSTGPSVCVQEQSASVSYLYAQRITGTNSAEFFFSLSPSGLDLASDSFSGKVTTNAPSSDIQTTYSSGNSRITVTIEYNTDMEGNEYWFTFDFSSATSFYANAATTTGTTNGINEQLVVIDMIVLVKSVLYSLMALAVIGLGMGVFSSIAGHKLMGLQLVLALQGSYFCFLTIKVPKTYLTGLRGLQFSNGYGEITTYDYENFYQLDSKLPYFDLQVEYGLNVNVMLAVAIISAVIFLIVQLRFYYNYQAAYCQQLAMAPQQQDTKKKGKQGKKEEQKAFEVKEEGPAGEHLRHVRQIRNNYVNHYFFFLLAALVQQCVFAFMTQNMQSKVGAYVLNDQINTFVSYLGVLFAGLTLVFLVTQYLEKKEKRVLAFKETKMFKYPVVLLLCYFLLAVGVGASYTYSFAIYVALVLTCVQPIAFICLRPYRKSDFAIDTFTAFACHLTPLLVTIVLLLNQISDLQETQQLISTAVVAGIVLAIQILTIIRLVRTVPWGELWLAKKCFKKEKRRGEHRYDDERLMEKDNSIEMSMLVKENIMNDQKMVDWQVRNEKEYESIHSRTRSRGPKISDPSNPSNRGYNDEEREDLEEKSEEEEVDELSLLKQRLKKEIGMKRSAL